MIFVIFCCCRFFDMNETNEVFYSAIYCMVDLNVGKIVYHAFILDYFSRHPPRE